MAVDLIAQTVYGFAIHGSPPQEMFSPDLAGAFAEKSDPAGWSANHVLRLATFQTRHARDSLSVISRCVRS